MWKEQSKGKETTNGINSRNTCCVYFMSEPECCAWWRFFLMNQVFECHPITDSQHIYGLVNVSLWVWSVCFSSEYTTHTHTPLVACTLFDYDVCVRECLGHIHHKHTQYGISFFFNFISFFLWHETQLYSVWFHSISTSLFLFDLTLSYVQHIFLLVFNPRHRNVSLFFFVAPNLPSVIAV